MTQAERIMKYLDDYGSITPMQAFFDLGITKLATRISEMTRRGERFEKKMVTTKNRYGESVSFMMYMRAV